MSWYQFKQPIFPLSHRHHLRAVLPQTNAVFTITHLGIQRGEWEYFFEKPLERSSMVTQLELHRQTIRISYRDVGRQHSYKITPEGVYQDHKLVAKFLEPIVASHHPLEVLHLGSHQQLDIDHKGRILDVKALFPAWFSLGQIAGEGEELSFESLQEFYLDGIEDLFAPKNSHALKTGFRSIRSLFFQEEGNQFSFLPKLPPKIDSGCITLYPKDLTITFEWSKREVKRVMIHAKGNREITLGFPYRIVSFEKRFDAKAQKSVQCQELQLSLKQGEYVFLDHFRR